MRLDKKLNLVIPVDTETGTIHVHATPISREVFETYFFPISKTFAAIYRQQLEIVAGPRIAMLMLKQTSRDLGMLDGPDGVQNGLIAEMRRITNVAIPGEKGWTAYPLQDVIDRELLSEEDIEEIEGIICFFTCASAMHRRKELPAILNGMCLYWDAQTTSSPFTEYLSSLPSLTEAKALTTETSLVPS